MSIDIKEYSEYFESQINEILLLNNALHKKILLVSIFDSLARVRFPDMDNKARFLEIIKTCSNWSENQLISLPQLSLAIGKISPNSLLDKEVKKRIREWEHGRIYNIAEVDVSATAIDNLAINKEEKACIKKAKHDNLFYIYRNHLVHEFREPGTGHDFAKKAEPYYHGKASNSGEWELIYPLDFFFEIVRKVLKSAVDHLKDNETNPHSAYKIGRFWEGK